MRYRVSKEADRDVEDIFLYWAKRADLTAAEWLIDSMTDRFSLLSNIPTLDGRSRTWLRYDGEHGCTSRDRE